METINLHAAKTHLSKLVDRVLAGDDIVIAKAGKPMVKLVPVNQPSAPRELGKDAGKVWIADDFDAPLPQDLQAHFE